VRGGLQDLILAYSSSPSADLHFQPDQITPDSSLLPAPATQTFNPLPPNTGLPTDQGCSNGSRNLLLALLASPLVMAENSVMKQLSSSQFTGFMKLMEHAEVMPEVEAALKANKGLSCFAPTERRPHVPHLPHPPGLPQPAREQGAPAARSSFPHRHQRLSPFQWEGAHKTLCGSDLPLSMDAQAFYANNVAVMQYNALVGSADAAVHSIPTLMVPNGFAGSSQFVEEGSVRRSLVEGKGPRPRPHGLPTPYQLRPQGGRCRPLHPPRSCRCPLF